MFDSGSYRFLDRLLHRLALQPRLIAEMSFDLDQMIVKTDPVEVSLQRHVFVSGLARAGTTVLMRRFYETGLFGSLTYRDMPFVLAPRLWRRLTSISKREVEGKERAHGDNLFVNLDSPESLDEVFWRIFAGGEYIEIKWLKPHDPSEELTDKYVSYVSAILSTQAPRRRYLAKNNNNILRLGAIHRAFPNALILIPFRDPIQHASSLLRQHRHFSEIQKKSGFVRSYMTWLGHHEFGMDHRRFRFKVTRKSEFPTDTLDYWLQLWCEVYACLIESKPDASLFVCYEDICASEEYWEKLAALANIPARQGAGLPFRLSTRSVNERFDEGLAGLASEIYASLVTYSRAAFPTGYKCETLPDSHVG